MKRGIKSALGILLGLFFLYLAFRKVNLSLMIDALRGVNYWHVFYALIILFFSHYLRSLRWRYLLDPMRRLDIASLFSSLMIGYMANVFTPAHLGEVLRAYILGKKRNMAVSSVLATIVVERIVDVLSLVGLTFLVIVIHPFPAWVTKSGYIMLAATLGLFLVLILLKKNSFKARRLIAAALKRVPHGTSRQIAGWLERFLSGIMPLRRRRDYLTIGLLSVAIWGCYFLAFLFCLHGFGFVKTYSLPWYTSLVLLVITTTSVVIPSSPGYVGPYHYLCQVSLAMFGVPATPALSFAAVVHAVNFLPVLLVGLIVAGYEGVSVVGVARYKTLIAPLPEPAEFK